MSNSNSVSPTLSAESQAEPLFAAQLVKKYDLTEENERLAHTAMLALVAQANLNGQPIQKDYVERLNGFFQKYQDLVKELQEIAEPQNL